MAAGQKKGLDLDLLAKEKARIAAAAQVPSPADEETGDEELEAAWADGQQKAPTAPSKFRSVTEAPEIIYVNGKRMRKKKKKTAATIAPASHGNVTDKTTNIVRVPPPALPEGCADPTFEKQATHAPSFAVQVDDNDDDADIFGEAGVWDGLSDDENEKVSTEQAPTTSSESTQRNWFATETTPSPPPTKAVAAEVQAEAETDESESPPARLEGLSSSALPSDWSRWLLEREEARDARRAHSESGPVPRKRKRSKKGRGDVESP